MAGKEIAVKKYVVRLDAEERDRTQRVNSQRQAFRPAADEGAHPVEGGHIGCGRRLERQPDRRGAGHQHRHCRADEFNWEALHGQHDTLASIQASYPRAVDSRRNACSQPSACEIRRQPVGRSLLDRTWYRRRGAAQAERAICNHHRRQCGSTPAKMGRKLGSSSPIISNANCMRCIMPGAYRPCGIGSA